MVCVPVAMAASTAVSAPSSIAGGQSYWRNHFNRSKGHKFRRMTRASSHRSLLFPVAAKKKGRQEATTAPEESPYSILTAVSSRYNEIVVLETPETRILLLDSSHNIHSILHKEQKWTGSYWDEFASLPAIIPKGPIAILGLGAGTAAHLILDLWPSFCIEGWEIDGILIDIAREYFALSDLESCSKAGGSLSIHIGDALSPSATVEGGFAVKLEENGRQCKRKLSRSHRACARSGCLVGSLATSPGHECQTLEALRPRYMSCIFRTSLQPAVIFYPISR